MHTWDICNHLKHIFLTFVVIWIQRSIKKLFIRKKYLNFKKRGLPIFRHVVSENASFTI